MIILARPRVVSVVHLERPCLVFTDGAVEAEGASYGALIISPRSPKMYHFGLVIPETVIEAWASAG
eukprot:4753481-Amphidinium_carterae.1